MSSVPVFTVFDTETTGLDPLNGHKIIEIAGVRVENGTILKESVFTKFVNPERSIPPEAAQINKIAESDVADAPTIGEVLPQFLEFASDSILVAHNANFDMGFLEVEKQHCWGYMDLPECLCTMKLSQALFPTEFRHTLDVVATRLDLEIPANRHRALPDVLLTAEALVKMLDHGNITSLDELRVKAGMKEMVA